LRAYCAMNNAIRLARARLSLATSRQWQGTVECLLWAKNAPFPSDVAQSQVAPRGQVD
jgi:hypothetical protein